MSLKFPVNNIRKSINDVWQQLYSTETRTVPSATPYVIELYEVPDDGFVNDKPEITGLTETLSYPPSAGQFYVNYNNGHLAFNSNESGNTYDIKYWKKGTLVEAEEINYLYDRINQLDSIYTVSSTAPSATIQGSQWYNTNNNILYTYDTTRSKWLSIEKINYVFGRDGLTNKQYLSYYTGNVTSNRSGLRILRDGCIVSLSGQFTNLNTGTFYIRKNNTTSSITSLNVITDYGNSDDTININVSKGDIIQCYFESVFSTVKDPMVVVEIAWR
jgi:hypothetical protein